MSNIIERKSIGGDVISLIDESDPRSVYHLLPEAVQKYVKAVPDQLWELSFADLTKATEPGVELKQLRIAFWMEYERAKRNGTPMTLTHICHGIMSRQRFHSCVLAKSTSLVFLLTPPEDYRVRMEEMLQLALEEERKILELPLTKKKISIDKATGEAIVQETIDTSIASVKHRIRESLQNRLYGLPVARIHQVNKNIGDSGSGEKNPEDMTPEELDKYINTLRAKQAGHVIDVSGVTDDGEAKDGRDV